MPWTIIQRFPLFKITTIQVLFICGTSTKWNVSHISKSYYITECKNISHVICQFVEKPLKQKRGTAIGKKFGPPYSILFMQNWKKIFEKQNFNHINGGGKLMIYFSFGSMEKKDWNPLEHQTIKFTAGWSKTSTNFLHLTESITEDIKETDLYAKTADSDKYFLSSSCHHSYWKKHIPCSRALRLNRSCLNNQFFDKKCNGLRNKGTTMRKWYIRKNFEL